MQEMGKIRLDNRPWPPVDRSILSLRRFYTRSLSPHIFRRGRMVAPRTFTDIHRTYTIDGKGRSWKGPRLTVDGYLYPHDPGDGSFQCGRYRSDIQRFRLAGNPWLILHQAKQIGTSKPTFAALMRASLYCFVGVRSGEDQELRPRVNQQ